MRSPKCSSPATSAGFEAPAVVLDDEPRVPVLRADADPQVRRFGVLDGVAHRFLGYAEEQRLGFALERNALDLETRLDPTRRC